MQRYDPTYQATKLHFDDLAKRYGNPIIVLNLIKVHPCSGLYLLLGHNVTLVHGLSFCFYNLSFFLRTDAGQMFSGYKETLDTELPLTVR